MPVLCWYLNTSALFDIRFIKSLEISIKSGGIRPSIDDNVISPLHILQDEIHKIKLYTEYESGSTEYLVIFIGIPWNEIDIFWPSKPTYKIMDFSESKQNPRQNIYAKAFCQKISSSHLST